MPVRHIYLKIERITKYSPVAPMEKTPPSIIYKRDGMRNHGHDDGSIPDAEVEARSMTAVVYREYLDEDYLTPKTTKIVAADVNEPVWDRRVPGTVIYAHIGETLMIHVLNADIEPHSLHVHGLEYGIDSDGSWPFGTQATDGRRSDEICPGQSWTYRFRLTKEMVGAWPFHDHVHHADAAIKRGLFGGIVVRPRPFKTPPPVPLPKDFPLAIEKVKKMGRRRLHRDALPPRARAHIAEVYDLLREWLVRDRLTPPLFEGRLHVPLFIHEMATDEFKPVFDSGELHENGMGTYSRVFDSPGTFDYFCTIHPDMTGTVVVQAAAPGAATVNILDVPDKGFYPQVVTIAPGGTVTWVNLAADHHTVTSRQGASIPTHCLNGRGFVGNSPTILARSGQPIRWYVFNLDMGVNWHNFHLHGLRWQFAGGTYDVRSLGPAESFVVDTQTPPVILLPEAIEVIQDEKKRPKEAKLYRLMGDFTFHCHVHHHMTNGMVGVVRAYHDVWLTPAMKQQLEDEVGIIIFDPTNPIPNVEHGRCKKHGEGKWEELAVAPEVTFMHACLLQGTSRVLYWGYTRPDQSRLFDPTGPAVSAPNPQPAALPGMNDDLSDLWSAGHAFLGDANGTLLANGGFTGPGTDAYTGNIRAFLFDPTSETWAEAPSTQESRFYATTLSLADPNKVLTMYGSLAKSIEVYDSAGAGSWSAPIDLTASMPQHEFYPWTYLLPDGRLFIAGPHDPANRFNWNPPANIESFPNLAGSRSSGGEKGTSVLLPLRPPLYEAHVLILGGDTNNPGKIPAAPTAEMMDLSQPTPAWEELPPLNFPRAMQVNSVLLPDGRVFIAGGINGVDGGPCEFFDPANPGEWKLGPTMKYVRGYHSAMILLADGSILAGGDPNSNVFERYLPGYYFQPRPVISNAPASVGYGATFTIDTPHAAIITEVMLMRPGAVTHGFNMSQRAVQCDIVGGAANSIDVDAPPHGNVAPPGWYLLFMLDANRVPSEGRWLRLI